MSGIYIHIPFCKQKCTYCDFTSFPDKLAFAEAYMACLYKEMQLRAEQCIYRRRNAFGDRPRLYLRRD